MLIDLDAMSRRRLQWRLFLVSDVLDGYISWLLLPLVTYRYDGLFLS